MKLERLSLANCGAFEQIDIDFEPDVTIIAGVNGVGKSTLLRLIAIILSRTNRRLHLTLEHPLALDKDIVFHGASSAGASLTLSISDRRMISEITGKLGRSHFAKLDIFGATDWANHQNMLSVLFTTKRQLPGKPRSLAEARSFNPSKAYSLALYDREVDLREFMHWFRTQEKLGSENEPRRLRVLEALRNVVTVFIPEFSNLRIQETPRLGFIVDKGDEPLYIHQLSDGERGLLALVFDLTRRLAIANPESDDPIANGKALVLIDEIELHLHPKWQRQVIRKLRDIFKSCQFIMTTHSPQVIGEVQARCVRLLTWKDGRIASETPGMAFGTDSNWILNVLMEANEMNESIEDELSIISEMITVRNLKDAREKINLVRSRVGNTEEIQRRVSIIERIERLGK